MEEMTKEEFLRQKAEAEKRMRSLYGGKSAPHFPSFVSISEEETNSPPKGSSVLPPSDPEKPVAAPGPTPRRRNLNPPELFKFINLPELIKNPDGLLILGLIFLLINDNADEILIMALIFIML